MTKFLLPITIVLFVVIIYFGINKNRAPFTGTIINLEKSKTEYIERDGVQKERLSFRTIDNNTSDTVLAYYFVEDKIKDSDILTSHYSENELKGRRPSVEGYVYQNEYYIESVTLVYP